uniref:Bromodomain adjacent to zinc finger domain, 2A n=1 Tax=Salarias fasciatus TaxID=181472 RepID=A0A672JHP9_SALFA
MDSNNHFNYGTHSSANSGLKLSSGDSLYTNGSSMSFPQQGKNMNGEMNVNGVTTVLGSSVPGSHPPSASYPHMSNHHQSSMGYDYLWGGHPQYGPAMGASPGHGMHQKQPGPGMVQPQSQHHFQSHGQYQLNGGIERSHQPPVAGPANMPLTGSQYWNRSNPGPQISYNSHSMYGTYQSQAHPGITPSQHHQQQPLQPPPHQASQQHLHSHRHPHPHHHHQQHQQPQHYGMMPNGMPYYQHQPQHPSLPSPQQQHQAQMMPPAAQNFTPPRGSPQHHSLGRGSTGSPLPMGMSSAPMISPSAMPDRHTREAVKDVDSSYNGSDRAPLAQRLHKTDIYQPSLSPGDYRLHPDKAGAPRSGMASPVRDPLSHSVSSQLPVSTSAVPAPPFLTKAPTPPRVSSASAFCGSPSSASGPPAVSSFDVKSALPQIAATPSVSFASSPSASPRLSSPPLMVQGLRPPTSCAAEKSSAGSKHLSAGPSSSSSSPSPSSSSSPLSVSPSKLSSPLATSENASRPAPVSSGPPVSSSADSLVPQSESALPPRASGLFTTTSPPATVSTSSYSAPVSSPEMEVPHRSKPPSMTPSFLDIRGSQHERVGPPRLLPVTSLDPNSLVSSQKSLSGSSDSTSPGSCLSTSVSVSKSPSAGSKLSEPEPASQCQTPQAGDSGPSSASSAPEKASVPSLVTREKSCYWSIITTLFIFSWRREIRVKKLENRMKGETWYYTPCGRRMKQFPEIVKYLKRHTDSIVSREHFSFSPRMPVGDFFEERETSEGVKWVLLANEEVPSMIMAITGRRGRPPNPDKEKPRRVRGLKVGPARRPGRPPKPQMTDLLSKVDAKLLKRLEAKEALTEEEKEKLAKIKKKMKRKQEGKNSEGKTESADLTAAQGPQQAVQPAAESKKPGRRRSVKAEAAPPVQQTDVERIAQGKRVLGARSKAKALAKAQAEAEAAARAALAAKRAAERRAQAQRRLEERKRQQLIAEELKKPAEDMCLTDHKLLPELTRIPGVVLSGTAFAHCLSVVEFLHGYGKLIGLNIPKDIPSLATLQEGLLGLGDSQGEVQDLLIKLVEAALHDPGLPSYYQSVKILGDKLVELELTRSTVSEVLRIFLESHGYETEVCNTLRTKTFHTLPPDTKAAILGFLVDELNSSNIVTSDIDNTLENMTTYRKNKWIIEGKLRKLKAALARRTGRSEEELCFEERRRSARVAEEENLNLEENGLILERASRRSRKEEPKLSDSENPTNASIPELERQIDKLTKRQAFFRKKLLQSSHSMRAILLGQDRYRRRYMALPHLGGVLVEGPEELLSESGSKVTPMPTTPPPTLPSSPSPGTPGQPPALSPEDDPLPGTASLMSRPRGRGRPRKIKPEVELHLRTAKIRRRRRSSVRSSGDDGPGSPNGDLTQAAFQSWLSQSQEAATNGTCSAGEAPEGNRPEESVKEMAEKQGQWFNLLPKQPCDDNSLTEPQIPKSPNPAPAAPDCPPTIPQLLPADTPPALAPALSPAPPPPAPVPVPAPAAPSTPARPNRRRRRGSRGSSPARRGPRGAAAKRRGRPPNSVFQELEQQFFTQLVVKPIPASMVRGWWWIKDPEELYHTLQALHPRGVRERVLHKHLAKHMESLAEMCTKPINDPLFQLKVEAKDVLLEALQQPWQVQEKAMETDISALQWVEDLEQRVVAADLHLKSLPQNAVTETETNAEAPMPEFQPYTIPEPDSTRDDLQYYEHDTDPRDDWIVRTKKEWSGLPRIATHPVDLAVLRLANLERNIERRYLKEPLWNPAEVMRLAPLTPTPGEEHPMDVISLESEITSRLRTWRQALDRCRSAPQLCLCLLQLEKAIAWERSVTKVTCQVCKKGDNDDCLLLCDGCDRGCHMYCLRPKITQVPEGDWFCPTCVAQDECESPRSSKKRTRVKKRRYEDDSSDEEVTTTTTTTTTRRSGGMTTRLKEAPTPAPSPASSSRHSGEGSSAKRRRMMTRNQPDLTFCEIILMEMEAHADAWPFLEPVNPRLVPGYRRIIKNPMDFLTMRERLLQGGYCSCDEFAADAQLVFNNCELFNEDTSEVGLAGHSMRRFFESRWAEFYSNKDK